MYFYPYFICICIQQLLLKFSADMSLTLHNGHSCPALCLSFVVLARTLFGWGLPLAAATLIQLRLISSSKGCAGKPHFGWDFRWQRHSVCNILSSIATEQILKWEILRIEAREAPLGWEPWVGSGGRGREGSPTDWGREHGREGEREGGGSNWWLLPLKALHAPQMDCILWPNCTNASECNSICTLCNCIQCNPLPRKDFHRLTTMYYMDPRVRHPPLSFHWYGIVSYWPDIVGDDFCKLPSSCSVLGGR